jgi:signal transduction histidine kinase
MRERFIFFYIISLVGAALSFFQRMAAAPYGGAGVSADAGYRAGLALWEKLPFVEAGQMDADRVIVFALAAAVLISAALLLNLLRLPGAARAATVFACAAVVWTTGPSALPAVAGAALAALGTTKQRANPVVIETAILCLLFAGLFWPQELIPVVAAAFILGFSFYALRLMERLAKLEQSAEGLAAQAGSLRELLGSQRRMVKSREQISRLEERNRLAARIHDEIGHGMSGSILLLEGADLVMDKEPEKARETMRKVTENLRASVEEVRKVLREERSSGTAVSLARIADELTAFEAEQPRIRTRLDTDGDMSEVNGAIWTCVYENMTEALTNVLKHSEATLFRVSLKNRGGLLFAEFADNGEQRDRSGHDGNAASIGIGLQNMEERAAMCYGRCFFRHESDGFHIVMTFPIKKGFDL